MLIKKSGLDAQLCSLISKLMFKGKFHYQNTIENLFNENHIKILRLLIDIGDFNSILMKDKYCFVNSTSHRDKQYKKKEATFQSKMLLLFCTRLLHEKM
jgi:hypothetical protein